MTTAVKMKKSVERRYCTRCSLKSGMKLSDKVEDTITILKAKKKMITT